MDQESGGDPTSGWFGTSLSQWHDTVDGGTEGAYGAEKQALRCMQKALRKASAEALRDGIQMHIEQTQVQIERVEQAMVKLSVRPSRKICEGRQGGRRRLPFRQPPQSGLVP